MENPLMSVVRSFEGHTPTLGQRCWLDPSAVVVGQVVMGNDCSVWPTAVVRGDVHSITVGDRTNIQDGTVCHTTHASPHTSSQGHPLIIGHDVTIGHRVVLHGCTLEDHILVGMNSVIMDAAHLEPYVIVGAGSLVPPGKRLVGGFLYLGNPAQQKRALTNEERSFLSYSASHYVRLKDRYLALLERPD